MNRALCSADEVAGAWS